MEEREKKPDQVSWNLGEQIIFEIAGLLKGSSRCYVKKEYANAFDNLKAIKLRISADLRDNELEAFQELEDSMYLLRKTATSKKGFGVSQEAMESGFKLWKELDKYNLLLMKALKKYGYAVPLKKDQTVITA